MSEEVSFQKVMVLDDLDTAAVLGLMPDQTNVKKPAWCDAEFAKSITDTQVRLPWGEFTIKGVVQYTSAALEHHCLRCLFSLGRRLEAQSPRLSMGFLVWYRSWP